MRFTQLDRILSLKKGESIEACRCLALSEGYLADHFPRFPVLPGVLMLESLFQAGMWLVRVSEDFESSYVALKETKSMKFQGFVQPGDTLNVSCQIKSRKERLTNLRVSGSINGEVAVAGRMVLESYNLADRGISDAFVDEYNTAQYKKTFRLLCDQMNPNNPSKTVMSLS